MAAKRTYSSKPTASKKRKPAGWKKGQSGNPNGAPPKGESWAEILREVGCMTGFDLAAWANKFARDAIRQLGDVRLKDAVAVRIYQQLLNEPTGALVNTLMDRTDGKVPTPVEVAESGVVEVHVKYEDADPSEASRAAGTGQE